ncbi:MAG TPA: hypothetical protein VFN62_02820, partial [Acidobacteriaceae bacterium]|nr:hypothetical protein [Acidobacteriaceae bacterium]
MSSIQPIHAASANGAPQPAASTEPAGAKPGHPFAEVMRSVAIPAAGKPSVSNASGATASAHSLPSQSTAGFKTHMNGKDAPASKPSNQAANGNPAIVASNQDGRNADPSPDMAVSSGAADGLGSFVAEGQVSSAASVARAADQSGYGARVLSGAAQPASSPSETARKQTPPAKRADANAHVSPSPAIAPATRIEIASVPAIAVNIPVVKPPTRVQAGLNDELKSTSGMKPIDAYTMAKDSSLLRRAAASGPAVRIPQAGGSG